VICFINKSDENMLQRLSLMAGDEDTVLLLAGDAVFLAMPFWQDRLADLNVEEVYAVRDDVEARNIELAEDARAVGYDKIVDLLLSGEQVICL